MRIVRIFLLNLLKSRVLKNVIYIFFFFLIITNFLLISAITMQSENHKNALKHSNNLPHFLFLFA